MSEEQNNVTTTTPVPEATTPVVKETVAKEVQPTAPTSTFAERRASFKEKSSNRQGTENRAPRDGSSPRTGASGQRPSFGRTGAPSSAGGRDGQKSTGGFGRRNDRRAPKGGDVQELESKVIEVRRVTRVVKGGKRMRFSALVVVGDREGKVGFGLKKGADFQDAVSKATKQANNKLIKITMNEDKSFKFASNTKHKSCEIFLRPAKTGVGLIAGGFIRPVLELAGIQNAYSKINRSRNKVVGVQSTIKALLKYSNTKQI
jgi:small subunit ribosomal protein S5